MSFGYHIRPLDVKPLNQHYLLDSRLHRFELEPLQQLLHLNEIAKFHYFIYFHFTIEY